MNVTAKAFMDYDSANFRKTTDAFKNNLEEATDIVLTLGVSLCPFRGKDFVFSIPPSKAAKDPSVKFYIVNPQRNADNIVDILNSIRSINKNIRVFISISPVPLRGSPNGNVVIDDFRSKSSIRMAIDILNEQSHPFHYWPSFEVVKWYSAHLPFSTFGADAGNHRHVNQFMIDYLTDKFLMSAFY